MEFLFGDRSTAAVTHPFSIQQNVQKPRLIKAQKLWLSIQNLFPPPTSESLDHLIAQELEILMMIG